MVMRHPSCCCCCCNRRVLAVSSAGGKSNGNARYPIIAGALAGGIEICITYPLESIKAQMQLHESIARQGILRCGQSTVVNHGVAGLYRGLSSWLVFAFPKTAIRFPCQHKLQSQLNDHTSLPAPAVSAISGGAAGVLEALITGTPMNTIQVRMVDDIAKGGGRFRGFTHAVITLLREEGPRGIYRAPGPLVTKIAVNQSIRFTVFGTVSAWLQHHGYVAEGSLPVLTSLAIGALAGGTSVFVTQPIDVVKTKMQGLDAHLYRGSMHCLRTVIRRNGLAGLYQGVTPRLIRVMMEVGLHFTLYNELNRMLSSW